MAGAHVLDLDAGGFVMSAAATSAVPLSVPEWKSSTSGHAPSVCIPSVSDHSGRGKGVLLHCVCEGDSTYLNEVPSEMKHGASHRGLVVFSYRLFIQ
ncbi:hypothetical protein MRX96_013517 [Rhipicephalus microplus]